MNVEFDGAVDGVSLPPPAASAAGHADRERPAGERERERALELGGSGHGCLLVG